MWRYPLSRAEILMGERQLLSQKGYVEMVLAKEQAATSLPAVSKQRLLNGRICATI